MISVEEISCAKLTSRVHCSVRNQVKSERLEKEEEAEAGAFSQAMSSLASHVSFRQQVLSAQ